MNLVSCLDSWYVLLVPVTRGNKNATSRASIWYERTGCWQALLTAFIFLQIQNLLIFTMTDPGSYSWGLIIINSTAKCIFCKRKIVEGFDDKDGIEKERQGSKLQLDWDLEQVNVFVTAVTRHAQKYNENGFEDIFQTYEGEHNSKRKVSQMYLVSTDRSSFILPVLFSC